MEKIRKGTKAKYTGYLITDDEQKEYLKLKEAKKILSEKWNEYLKKYHPNKL